MTPVGHPTRMEARIDALERQLDELRGNRRRRPRLAVPRTRPPRLRSLIAFGVLIVLVALPAGIAASHQFTDVPNTNTFHGNISDVADAGITAGCDTDLYCPDAAVTRGQMAAFLHRASGRVASDWQSASTATETTGTYDRNSVTIKAGDVTGGHGYLFVTGTASVTTQSSTACPCTIRVRAVVDGAESGFDAWEVVDDAGGPFGGNTWRFGSVSLNDVFYVTTGVAHTVLLRVTVTRSASIAVGLETSFSAVYVPFNGNGDVVAPALVKPNASTNDPSN